MNVTLIEIKNLKLNRLKNNHIYLSNNKIANNYGDKRSNNLIHGIGYVLFQKNSEQEKVVEFDNYGRKETGDSPRIIDPAQTNTLDPK